jgi:hypothetical protein
MAQPVFYQTMNNVGIDPTLYYTFSASVTPETPAAPFLPGTQALGSDGSQFVFVQASTSISLTDFVIINSGQAVSPYQANSVSNTTVASSLALGLGSAGLVLKQSVTFIPAGAFFWALTRGTFVPATTSGGSSGLASNSQGVVLFTSTTTGILSSLSSSVAAALQGVVCVNSLTLSTGISSSIVPPVGTLSTTGLTVGPVVAINNPRTVLLWSSSTGITALQIGSF